MTIRITKPDLRHHNAVERALARAFHVPIRNVAVSTGHVKVAKSGDTRYWRAKLLDCVKPTTITLGRPSAVDKNFEFPQMEDTE